MWVPTSATLIYGQKDAVLVDALLTVAQVNALVEWVVASGKNLTTIYVTHGHGDHFFGLAALLDHRETRQYIRDFDRLAGMTRSARELYDKMLELYPNRANPGSLWGAARAAKG
jgi:glyoxylase-like metal-dependent hydrolase (beta-lactamase superfamily II)